MRRPVEFPTPSCTVHETYHASCPLCQEVMKPKQPAEQEEAEVQA